MSTHENHQEGWALLSQGEANYLFTNDDPLDEIPDPQQMLTGPWDETTEDGADLRPWEY